MFYSFNICWAHLTKNFYSTIIYHHGKELVENPLPYQAPVFSLLKFYLKTNPIQLHDSLKHSSRSLYIINHLTLKDSLFSNDRISFKNQFHRNLLRKMRKKKTKKREMYKRKMWVHKVYQSDRLRFHLVNESSDLGNLRKNNVVATPFLHTKISMYVISSYPQ